MTTINADIAHAFCRPIATGDGKVCVRPIRAEDGEMAQAFVAGLSSMSRYFRFFQSIRELSPGMLQRFTSVRPDTETALVGVAQMEGGPCMVGEARLAIKEDGDTAEFAIAIADDWQRRGIAAGMLGMLEHIAAASGAERIVGESFAMNEKFASFVRACGYDVRPDVADRSFIQVAKNIC